jgi:hypothetical protein
MKSRRMLVREGDDPLIRQTEFTGVEIIEIAPLDRSASLAS